MESTRWQPVPIGQRRIDLVFVAFFLLNVAFITYMVDLVAPTAATGALTAG